MYPYSNSYYSKCFKYIPKCSYHPNTNGPNYSLDTISIGGKNRTACPFWWAGRYGYMRLQWTLNGDPSLVCITWHKLPSLSDFQQLLSLPMTDNSFGFAYINWDFILDYGYKLDRGYKKLTWTASDYYRILDDNWNLKRAKVEGTCLSVWTNDQCTEYSQPTVSLDTNTLSSSTMGIIRCIKTNCPSWQHYENQSNSCVDNIRSCTITNGIGQQIWNDSRGTCQVENCNTNYCKYWISGWYQCLPPTSWTPCDN